MMLRQTGLRARVLPRTALSRLAVRPLCMHDDFKPKTKSYAGDDGDDVHAQIAKDVADNKVVVFMKGVPDRPQCGFSKTVTQILKAEGVPFTGFNVLADADLRNGVKTYSNWPTIPQVYIDGEFVGGCDTMMEMYKSGELRKILQEAGAVEAQK